MIIRKLFKFEASHMVRNCTTKRCSTSLHGHSFRVEIFLESDQLDFGGMVADFGIVKMFLNDFIDSFDHCYMLWDKESDEVKESIKKLSARWIELPMSPSAESLSIMFYWVIDQIINNIRFANGEEGVTLYAVRVHETDTGYAEARFEDLALTIGYELEDIKFSDQVRIEWKDKKWWYDLLEGAIFEAPKPIHQINPSLNETHIL